MAFVDEIPEGSHIAFDSDVVIYFVEENDEFLSRIEPLFNRVIDGNLHGHVSVVTIIEVLTGPIRDGKTALADEYREVFETIEDVTVHAVDRAIAELAAHIRAIHNLKTPDSIIAASAITAGCAFLVTNDAIFKRVDGIRALVIRDYA